MYRLRLYILIGLAALNLTAFPAGPAQNPESHGSKITIHVGKSGLFSAFGHGHTISAPIARLAIDPKSKTAAITVLTGEMKVVDPEVSDKDRAEIQATMLGPKVLDAEKFPEIKFTSSRIEETASGHFRVSGALQLHGVTKALTFPVTGTPEHYSGGTKLKQTDFGIEPVSVAGGAVKVKDEVEIEFVVYAGAESQPQKR